MPETGAGLKARLGRQTHRLFGRKDDVFGTGAERPAPLPVPHPHSLAEALRGHTFSDHVDLAGAVAVRDDAGIGDLPGYP